MRRLLFVVAQKCVLWYIINEKGQPPTSWVGLQIWKKLHPFTGQSLGVDFLFEK